MQTPLFPEVKSMAEVFELWRPYDNEEDLRRSPTVVGDYKFSGYIVRRDRISLWGEARKEFLSRLVEYLVVPDQMYWELIDREDNETSLYVRHNKIIGSRFVAELLTESIDGKKNDVAFNFGAPDLEAVNCGEDTDGVRAIMYLQYLAGIQETVETALSGWKCLSKVERAHTLAVFRTFKQAGVNAEPPAPPSV